MSQNHHGRKYSKQVTVAEFFKAGAKRLSMELVSGKAGMNRAIVEPSVNRPGLALTGFFRYFAHKRIQVLGHAEHAYLFSLDEGTRKHRLKSVFSRHVPCVVITRHRKLIDEIVSLGNELSIPVLHSPLITGRFVNLATLLMEDLQAPKITMQGTMVEILGAGILITGGAGIGKSETALTLIKRGASLISDDITAFRLDSSGDVIGTALDATRYHMELRGLGIIHVPSLFGVSSVQAQRKLDMIINLQSVGSVKIEPGVGQEEKVEVLGVSMPKVTIPVAPGRDIAGLIEVAALNHKLKRLGHDAAKELDERLIATTAGGAFRRE